MYVKHTQGLFLTIEGYQLTPIPRFNLDMDSGYTESILLVGLIPSNLSRISWFDILFETG